MFVSPRDLLAISVKNLVTRPSRTLFLSTGVLVGTGILLFVVGLIGGVNDVVQENIERSVEKVKSDQRAILGHQQELQGRLQDLVSRTPVNRIEVMPRQGGEDELKESDVARIEKEHAARIGRIVKIAFLFPMFAEVQLLDFEIEVGGEKLDFSKMMRGGERAPVSVYGVDPEELQGKILGPDEQPIADQAVFRYDPRERTPIVIPAEWFGFVKNIDSEDMRERLKMQLTAGLFMMMRDEKTRGRFVHRFGENFLTRSFAEEAVEDAIEQIYEKLRPENVRKHFRITLYAGMTKEDAPIATDLVGMSRATPFTGLTVPTGYVARWHEEFFKKNSGLLGMFKRDPEVNYSKIILYGKDLDATIEIVDALGDRYLVASEIEQARRLQDESRQIDAERTDLEAKERELLAESDRIRDVVGAIRDGAWLVGFLIFLLAGVGIVNGMTLSVMEQAKRIGILRAVGARRRDILFVFLSEAVLIGLGGSALGILLAEGAVRLADARLPEILPSMAYPPESFFLVTWPLRALVIAVGVLVSFAAGFFPALKGSWIRPVEVLRD